MDSSGKAPMPSGFSSDGIVSVDQYQNGHSKNQDEPTCKENLTVLTRTQEQSGSTFTADHQEATGTEHQHRPTITEDRQEATGIEGQYGTTFTADHQGFAGPEDLHGCTSTEDQHGPPFIGNHLGTSSIKDQNGSTFTEEKHGSHRTENRQRSSGRESHKEQDSLKKTRSKRMMYVATSSILLLQMCERVSYYSVVANMVLFCTSHLKYDTVDATTISLVFAGCVYLVPVLGGYVADAWTGRFTTLLISSVFILIGVALLVVSAIDYTSWFDEGLSQTGHRSFFMVGLALIGLGTGGIKANISPFGAEQVEELGKDAINSFFNWFYWITALGSVVAFTGVAFIQQNLSFVWGFVTPLLVMLLALVLFLVAKPTYLTSKPQGSSLKTFFSVLKQGLCTRRTLSDLPGSCVQTDKQERKQTNGLNKSKHEKGRLLDRAKISHGGDHDDVTVDGVSSVVTVLPFCALVIMFWAIFSQTQSSFFVQAVRMDVRIGDGKVPAAMLSSFTNLSIVLIIPVLDMVVYPCMTKIGLPLTVLRRIGLGLLFSALAVVVAGIVEIYRKENLKVPGGSHVQILAGEKFTASSMSVFSQTPQFVLVGIGEIFTAATTLEIGYTQAPPSLQGLLTGLFYAASGVGNFLSSGIMRVVQEVTYQDPWWGNDINQIKMENLMFLLAGLMCLDFIAFCLVAYHYSYKNAYTLGRDEVKVKSRRSSRRFSF